MGRFRAARASALLSLFPAEVKMPDAVQQIDVFHYNQAAWDQQARADCEWSRPVDAAAIAEARQGRVLA
ncbi:hypothetical protein ABI908_00310, partial [Chromobacterium phragmitis]